MISITDCEKEGIIIREGKHYYIKAHKHFDGVNKVFVIHSVKKQENEVARLWNKSIAVTLLNELEKKHKYVLPNITLKKIIREIEHSQMPEVEKYDLIREIREHKTHTDYIFHLLKENFIII